MVMTGQTSRASCLQWTLVIEALMIVEEVDVITLINVFKRSTKITSDVESKAREMISFKILQRLFDPNDRPIESVRCAQNSGVSFDYSEQCEDVLQQILGKMDDPNLWNESEKSKWNVKSFIAYKRRLNDTHVEGKTTYLTSLNQMIKSRKLNQDGTKTRDVNDAVINDQQKSPCVDDNVCQDTSNDGSRCTRTGALNGENEDEVCHIISNEGNKRKRIGDLCDKDGDRLCHDISNEANKRTRIGNLCDEDGDKVCQPPDTSKGDKTTRTRIYSDEECYQKELNDIDAKKQVFFSSNCKDKEGFSYLKDANRCMKCSKGGQLLICSSNACSFVFHESCLVSSTPFDYTSSGKFYCPFCKCCQSISEYWVAKKKTSFARNRLAAFNKRGNKNIESQVPNGVAAPDLMNEMTEISGKEGCNERSPEKERADVVDFSQKFQKHNKSFTDLFFPQRRRVPVPWTQSEEETLKKWVEKFKSFDNIEEGGFPWSKILELGASTFQKSRIPCDLKDKWRNMQKASKKAT